jgi:hypothetical protein
MPDRMGTHTRPADRKPLMGIAALVIAAVLVLALVWTSHDRQAARNDSRVGTTTETSPKNPTPAPGGGARKNGG